MYNNDLPYSAIVVGSKTNWAGIDGRNVADSIVTIALSTDTVGHGADLKIDDVLVAENLATTPEYYTYILKGAHMISTATANSILYMTITPLGN